MEPLISRVFGLFPYIEFSNGVATVHKATDSPIGCYGKIVPNMEIEGKVYTYKTLIDDYYNGSTSNTNFIEYAIGRVRVSEDEYPRNEYDLIPDYIDIVMANSLYDKMYRMKETCQLYRDGLKENTFCCICDKYERMGGDKMLDYLDSLYSIAKERADEYLSYARIDTTLLHYNVHLTSHYDDMGLMCEYKDQWIGGVTYNEGDLVYYNNESYICIKTNNGLWDEATEKIMFPYDDFKLIRDLKPKASYPINSDTENANIFINNFDKKVTDDGKVYEYGVTFKGIGESYQIEGKSDSKLMSLRRYKNYIADIMDDHGNVIATRMETPEYGYDWLYYYRVGMICNYSTLNDNYGNIAFLEGSTPPNVGDVCKDLYAYGDVILDIYLSSDINKITFEYVMGAHLKAKCTGIDEDDDGNKIYTYDSFTYDDEDSYHGVKYTESYYYQLDGEIADDFITYDKVSGKITKINTDKFNEYVKGADENNKKYEFILYQSFQTFMKNINNSMATITSIGTNFQADIQNYPDYSHNRIFRKDCYNGITYDPNNSIDVYIERGNAAAMEKHIKLGEIKSLEDMELYGNGSFFKIENSI